MLVLLVDVSTGVAASESVEEAGASVGELVACATGSAVESGAVVVEVVKEEGTSGTAVGATGISVSEREGAEAVSEFERLEGDSDEMDWSEVEGGAVGGADVVVLEGQSVVTVTTGGVGGEVI